MLDTLREDIGRLPELLDARPAAPVTPAAPAAAAAEPAVEHEPEHAQLGLF